MATARRVFVAFLAFSVLLAAGAGPAQATTTIRFEIPSSEFVTVKIFDLLGHEIATLVEERLEAGVYQRTLDAGNLPSGTYFCRLRAGKYNDSQRFLLLK